MWHVAPQLALLVSALQYKPSQVSKEGPWDPLHVALGVLMHIWQRCCCCRTACGRYCWISWMDGP